MAGSKPKTPQIRTLIAAAVEKAMNSGGAIPHQIVAAIRKNNPKAIAAETDAMVDMAMLSIVRQYGNLRAGSASVAQPDFFREYPVSESVIVPMAGKNGVVDKTVVRVDRLTIDQAREHVAQYKRKTAKSKRIVALERAIKDLAPYGTGDSTFAECWKAKMAKAKKTG
ncbi:MAG TPA: hypothetical protein VG387_05245 [Rhizomicrobium sp.]|jgi:hypothetical protein|nr:hypothetical protein [Rhizomicrobium sp.]